MAEEHILGKNIQPFGKVIKGFGNNGEDQTEGAIYKNSIRNLFARSHSSQKSPTCRLFN